MGKRGQIRANVGARAFKADRRLGSTPVACILRMLPARFAFLGPGLQGTSLATGRPRFVIANTIKGKGVSFMENGVEWHHKVPSAQQYEAALKELAA